MHVVFEFLGLVEHLPIKAAGVRAQRDFHALLDGFRKVFALQFRHLRPVAAAPWGDIHANGDRRYPINPSFSHFVHQGVGKPVTVFDRIHAGAQRSGDPVTADRVRRHFLADAMRFVHDGLCFFIGEIHHRVQHPVGFEVVAAVGVIFDPIGAVHRLLAHGLNCTVGSVHVLHTGGNL